MLARITVHLAERYCDSAHLRKRIARGLYPPGVQVGSEESIKVLHLPPSQTNESIVSVHLSEIHLHWALLPRFPLASPSKNKYAVVL